MKEEGNVMRERFVIGLMRLGIAAALVASIGTEAQAGCFYSGGTRICTSWYTGSEICDNIIRGLPSSLLKDCTPPDAFGNGTCPTLTCSAFGTVGDCSNPTSDTCSIEGVAICLNPTDKYNAQGSAYNLPGYLSEVAKSVTCSKNNGRCYGTAELDPDGFGICNNNWSFLTFTATKLRGEVCYCPGGYANGQCCATSDRDPFGACKTAATPVCNMEYCTADLSNYKCTKDGCSSIPYTCQPIP
jgi:hypothetical protein